MTRTDTDRIQLRNPDPTKQMPQMAKDQYALVHETALTVVPTAAPGITLEDYLAGMKARLPLVEGWDPSVSANWWGMAIKLEWKPGAGWSESMTPHRSESCAWSTWRNR